MIPDGVVGLVLFAASLGPGYVYVRVAERRRTRPDRSALVEAVEMVSIGGFASLLSALVVLAVGDASGVLDAEALGRDPNGYLFAHPARLLTSTILFLAIGYAGAAYAARQTHRAHKPVFEPGVTAWQRVFWWARPSEDHGTMVLAELRDGRRVAGLLDNFTADLEGNRELAVVAPIRVAHKGAPFIASDDAFVVVREADVVSISGRYRSPRGISP